jgi:hypothetical protein
LYLYEHIMKISVCESFETFSHASEFVSHLFPFRDSVL